MLGKHDKWTKHSINYMNLIHVKSLARVFGTVQAVGLAVILEDYVANYEHIEDSPVGFKKVLISAGIEDLTTDDIKTALECLIEIEYFTLENGAYYCDAVMQAYNAHIAQRRDAGIKSAEARKERAKKKPAGAAASKPKKEQARAPVESPESKELFAYIDEILKPFDGSRNANRDLEPEQADRLIEKWGMDTLKDMVNIYYSWKAGKKTKHQHTDFGTLFKRGNWVEERLQEQIAKYEGKQGGKHIIEPMDLSPRQQVARGIQWS